MNNKLKEVRREKLMTQVELAQKSGVSRPTIIDIERNKIRDLRASTMLKLAKALGVPVESIFF